MSVRPQEPQAHNTRGKPIPFSYIACIGTLESPFLPFTVIPVPRSLVSSRGHSRPKEGHDSIPSDDEGHRPANRDAYRV